MSFLLRRRHLIGAFLAACLLAIAGATPASAADQKLDLIGAYAGPVGPAAEVPTPGAPASDPYPGGRCGRPPGDAALPDDLRPLAAKAGSNPDECIAFFLRPPDVVTGNSADSPDLRVRTGDDAKRVTIDLPRGFQASPAGVPTCDNAQFRLNPDGTVPTYPATVVLADTVNACPTGSVVGRARIQLRTNPPNSNLDTLKIVDDSVLGNVYNLSPGEGEIARLGVEISIPLALPVRTVVKFKITGGANPHLQAVVEELPRTVELLRGSGPTRTHVEGGLLISAVGILAFGNNAEHPGLAVPAFAQQGTECGVDLSAKVSVTNYSGHTSEATTAPYQLTGCDALPFAPTVAVTDVSREPGVPTPATVEVNVPQATAPPLTALVKDVSVTLPEGLEVGAQVASGVAGLPLCSAAAFDVDSPAASTCPAGAKVGDAQIDSPLVTSPFKGSVFLGPQAAIGELPKLYVEVSLDGSALPDAARIKLVGTASVGTDGRVTATFGDNPQLRFNRIRLSFRGGANALFISPRACGTTTGSSTVSSSNGAAPVTGAISLTVDQNCATPGFSPSVNVSPTNPQAGATSPSVITVDRPDRSPWLTGVKVSLPPGLLAFLKNASECGTAASTTGNCPESSRIGTVRINAGAGDAPLGLTGALYLVQPPAGAVAGAVIVVRAKIGDLDLGDVVVPGRIELRPTDAGLDFITTAPTRVFNLPLNLRTIQVALDRDAFATNPSACGPLGYSSALTGEGGATAAPGGTVTYTGCANRPFQPALRATLTGEVKPLSYPGMYVEITPRAGDTNMKATTVVLPEGVAAATPNLQNRCEPAAFLAGSCAANTKVGTATINVAITDDVITGDIFLLKIAGEALPGLGISTNGRYPARVSSTVRIDKDGRLTVVFGSIPDLPITRLTVDVAGGPKGPLRLSSGDCAIGSRWDATFVGQGGQNATAQTGLRCAAKSSMRLSAKSGFSLRNFDFGGRKLQSAKVTVPKGYKFSPAAAKPKGRAWARISDGKAKLRITSKSLTVTTTSKKVTNLRVKLSQRAVTRTSKKKLKKGATVNITVRFAFTDGAIQTQTIKAKAG